MASEMERSQVCPEDVRGWFLGRRGLWVELEHSLFMGGPGFNPSTEKGGRGEFCDVRIHLSGLTHKEVGASWLGQPERHTGHNTHQPSGYTASRESDLEDRSRGGLLASFDVIEAEN